MPHTSRALALVALASVTLLGSSAIGCGGAGSGRSTLPREELSLLTLLPSDAFIAGRLDVEALRATPHWDGIAELMRAEEPSMAELVEGTRRVYFAVGGMVDMPPTPSDTDEQGNYRPRPAWVEWSERFGGHAPATLVIVEGAGARICGVMVEEHQHTSQGGFEVTDLDGVAVMTRGDELCALTFTPMVEAILEHRTEPSDIVHQLAGESPATIARLVLQVDSPTVTALIDRLAEPTADPADQNVLDAVSEEQAEELRAEMARSREAEQRQADFIQAAVRIVAHGLTTVSWQVAADADGVETRTHVAGLDESRLGMWRELSQMFFDILAAGVRTEAFPSTDEHLSEFVRSVHIDTVDDGYVIVRHTQNASISRILHEMLPGPAEAVYEAAVPTPAPEAYEAMDTALRESSGDQAAIVAALEPNVGVIRTLMDANEQVRFLTSLVNAYAARGRYAEAAELVTQSIEHARTYVSDIPNEEWRTSVARSTVCPLVSSACELYLAHGFAEQALAVTATSQPDSDQTCAQGDYLVSACAAGALAALGRTDEALVQLESNVSTADTWEYLLARVRVLRLGGRVTQAHALARDLCMGGPGSQRCEMVDVVLAELLGASATSWAAAEPTFNALAVQVANHQYIDPTGAVRFEVALCSARARLDGASEATRATCATALERAIAYHGEGHFQVAAVRLAYATALDRARQRTEAAALRAAAQPVVETLGPQHPLRARAPR